MWHRITLLLAIGIISANQLAAATFLPGTNEVLLIIGQNVPSVDGYVAATGQIPGGVMTYTSTARAEGLFAPANYGAGLVQAQYFVTNAVYSNTVIQLGLYINGDLANITNGLCETNLALIGNWITQARRPVYLRIGYEFDYPGNALSPVDYIAAYRHIVAKFRRNAVTNVAYVWHSCGGPTWNNLSVTNWYPGDEYVDWAGVSLFQQFEDRTNALADVENICTFARSQKKPIMICESTPFGGISAGCWTNWFQPCVEIIRRHDIRVWCYINTDWNALPMFTNQGWGDSRVQKNLDIKSRWLALTSKTNFLKTSPELISRRQP